MSYCLLKRTKKVEKIKEAIGHIILNLLSILYTLKDNFNKTIKVLDLDQLPVIIVLRRRKQKMFEKINFTTLILKFESCH